MSKKRGILMLIAGILIGAIITGSAIKVPEYLDAYNDEDKSRVSEQVSDKLDRLQDIVNKYYLNSKDLKEEDVASGIYKGYINSLKDPYSVYYNEEETKELNQYMSGTYSGIGAVISQDNETNAMSIVRCFEGSGAEESGLKPYDILVEVDGKDVTAMAVSKAVTLIKGEEGTTVKIKVYRPSITDYVELDIKRKNIEVPTVESEILDNNIGLITLTEFEESSKNQFNKAYKKLINESKVDGLIVDLRGNPGGLLSVVCDICGHFVPNDGLVVYTEDKNGKREEIRANTNNLIKIPLVVLVNENSASASEIFAGAVQDSKTGKIVGTTTFGKGVVQQVLDLKDGSSVKVTISKYFTPLGQDINGNGIKPDVEVELDEAVKYQSVIKHEQDNQLQEAINQINKQLTKTAEEK